MNYLFLASTNLSDSNISLELALIIKELDIRSTKCFNQPQDDSPPSICCCNRGLSASGVNHFDRVEFYKDEKDVRLAWRKSRALKQGQIGLLVRL